MVPFPDAAEMVLLKWLGPKKSKEWVVGLWQSICFAHEKIPGFNSVSLDKKNTCLKPVSGILGLNGSVIRLGIAISFVIYTWSLFIFRDSIAKSLWIKTNKQNKKTLQTMKSVIFGSHLCSKHNYFGHVHSHFRGCRSHVWSLCVSKRPLEILEEHLWFLLKMGRHSYFKEGILSRGHKRPSRVSEEPLVVSGWEQLWLDACPGYLCWTRSVDIRSVDK